MIHKLIFYGFSFLTLLSALSVILSRNPVRAVLSLVLTFFGAAGLWLLLQAEFLGIVLILVYVGAVMVLFLFVVMMLDIEVASLKEGFTPFAGIAVLCAVLALYFMVHFVGPANFGLADYAAPPAVPASASDTANLAPLLYTDYVLPFELAGVLLLIAIVAAISLTFRGSEGRLKQSPDSQTRVYKRDRLRIIKMQSEKTEGVQP